LYCTAKVSDVVIGFGGGQTHISTRVERKRKPGRETKKKI
jgi:hypothetical protein